jgi:hypothetical protein
MHCCKARNSPSGSDSLAGTAHAALYTARSSTGLAVQRTDQPRRFALAQGQQLPLVKAGAVHAAPTLDQVVRFVHQHCATG